jgi:hypothetical protein
MSTPHRRSTPARIWTMQRESGPRERTGRGPGASAAPPRCSRPHRLQPSDLSLLLLIVPPTGAVAPVHRGTTGRPAERPGRRRELRPAKAKPEARSAVTRGVLAGPAFRGCARAIRPRTRSRRLGRQAIESADRGFRTSGFKRYRVLRSTVQDWAAGNISRASRPNRCSSVCLEVVTASTSVCRRVCSEPLLLHAGRGVREA